MNLHFVCTGNVFRSRLAEAYSRYLLKNHPHYKITSSGVNASNAQDGPIAWYALRLIVEHELTDYLSPEWTQTTDTLLSVQDKVIFMQPWHYQQAVARFGYHGQNFLIWDIPDITPDMTDEAIIKFSARQFEVVKKNVDQLVNTLLLG